MWAVKLFVLGLMALMVDGQGDAPVAMSASYGYSPQQSGQYCAVKGYPKDKFRVGCSYTIKGSWQCSNYKTMTLWCVKNGRRAQAYYCCGRSCNNYRKPKSCDKPYPPPPPPPPPSNDCSYGQGKNDYNLGYKQGKQTLDTSFKQTGKDCTKLDSIYNTVQRNAPTYNPCLNKGWKDGAKSAYSGYQDGCISNCAGSGQDTGKSLGKTFCQVQPVAASFSASGPTVAICNAVEQTLCESTYENYVSNNCPDKRDADFSFYSDLMSTCSITTN